MSCTLTYEAERSVKVLLEKLSGVQATPFHAEALPKAAGGLPQSETLPSPKFLCSLPETAFQVPGSLTWFWWALRLHRTETSGRALLQGPKGELQSA